jgi:protein TonB
VAPGPEQSAAPVSVKPVQEIHQEIVSTSPMSLVANPVVANQSPIQARIVSGRSAKLSASSKVKPGHSRRWLYAVAAVLGLSGTGVGGFFWYDARLDTDYIVLNNQYEAMAHASAVSLAQAEFIDVAAEETLPELEPEETQPTKIEPESLDVKPTQPQPTAQRVSPVSAPPLPKTLPKTGSTVAALRPEPKANRPVPPMTSPLNLTPTESQVADGRGLAPVGTGSAAAPPPAPPPASPPRVSGRVVVGAEATNKAQPSYPRAASMARISGSVAVQVSINERGAVVDARAISGPALLRDAAVNAARRWRFTPSTIGGVPVKATKTIVFNFKADR